MKQLTTRAWQAGALAALLLLGGCAAPGTPRKSSPGEAARSHPRAEDLQRARAQRSERPAPRPERRAAERDELALREGIALYEEGDFDAAIKRLNGSEMNGAALRHRLSALKYTAFSYCVTNRPQQCRDAFVRALRFDPGFSLTQGEQGHPLWGPEFARAKQEAGQRPRSR